MANDMRGQVSHLRPPAQADLLPAEPSEFDPKPQSLETYAPPEQRLPPYVQHRDDANRVGMLVAEAVVLEYEKSAKAVEAMGEQFKAAGERAAVLMQQLADGQKQVQSLAEHYRNEGKRVFDQIQDCASRTERVQNAMKTMADEMHNTVAEAVNLV